MNEEAYPGDASSLISIARADAFEEIMSCIDGIGVPPGVWREAVDAGEEIGASEVPRNRDAEIRGFLERLSLDETQIALAASIASEHRLGRGESEVLALAGPGTRAIVGEGRAARAARSLGIVPVSTLFLPVLGRERGRLDADEAVALLRRLAVPTGATAEAVYAIEDRLRKDTR
jgi:predicted nucleic acid-binding protein